MYQFFSIVKDLTKMMIGIIYTDGRASYIKHSCTDINKIKEKEVLKPKFL